MKRKRIGYLLCLTFLGCRTDPEPFTTKLAGYEIHFPIRAYELDSTKYRKNHWAGSKYFDSTETVKVEWLVDRFEDGWNPDLRRDERQCFGVNIYLKNKGDKLDSVKMALEKQFGKTLLPVKITETLDEIIYNNPGYSCQLNSNTTLFLRKATCNQGDSWCQYISLRIGIGYNLAKDQLERLADTDSKIHKSYD